VPDAAHEALRDLVRAREAAKSDQRRARQRTLKFLLRRGLAPPTTLRAWGEKHWKWLWALKLEQAAAQHALTDLWTEVDHAHNRLLRLEAALDASITSAPTAMRAVIDALQALRGVSKLTAVTIATEVGEVSRFAHPRGLMGFSGAVPSEPSSGGPGKARRGAITKTGNAHLRRVLVEAAWSYRHRPRIGVELKKRQQGLDAAITEIAWKAQHRLHARYTGLSARGKPHPKVVTAVARELLGFIWAIGTRVEPSARERLPRHAA
jgi:transposase